MSTALRDLAVVQDDDLVEEIESLKLVGDKQGGPARGESEQIGGQGRARLGVQVRGRLVQDQYGWIGEQGPGQGEPLALAAGHGRSVRADPGVPPLRQGPDPGQQSGPAGRGGQLAVGGAGPGQGEVAADRGIEDVRILRAAADHGADLIGAVAAQVDAVEGDGAPGRVAEAQQHGRGRGLARTARADESNSPAWREVKIEPVERQRPVRLIPDLHAPELHMYRPSRQREGSLRLGHRLRRIQDRADAAG